MKRSVSKGVIFCLAVTLLICGVQGEESSCFGSYEHASKILCDPNSLCSLSDSAISCYCNTGYQGDATKFGSGCVSEGSKMLVEKRDAGPEPWVPGMWTPTVQLKPCWGGYIFAGTLLCQPGTTCMVSEHPFKFKCQCPPGKRGDGFDPGWGGEGCK